MEDKEKVHDEEITPLIKKIIAICKKENIPFFASFQYSDDEFCISLMRDNNDHIVFKHYDAIRQCIQGHQINVDTYILWLMRLAEKEGHSSVYLKLLGVSLHPEEKES